MKVLLVGGRFGVLLSRQEWEDLLTCVEAYVTGLTGPSAELDPEVREFYPDVAHVSEPVPERFWNLHAKMGTQTPRKPPKTAGS